MEIVLRFLVFNLLLSLVAGLLAWVVVYAVVRVLDIHSSTLSFCFFSLPLLKSLLILVGLGWVFPWPAAWFGKWHDLALPPRQSLLILAAWGVALSVFYLFILRRARQAALQDAQPARDVAPRLDAIYTHVLDNFQRLPCPECSDDLCCTVEFKLRPHLLVSKALNTPLALIEGGEPAILFPAGLAARLEDDELAGALAHELAHFHLRRPGWCSASTFQKLTLLNPVTALVGAYLHRQEEKACDELAVSILGQPEIFAGMLTKSYRYARENLEQKVPVRLQVLPRLVGFRPLLSERVEQLLRPGMRLNDWRQSRLLIWAAWAALFALMFSSWSG